MNTFKRLFLAVAICAAAVSCNKKTNEEVTPGYQVPATYNFTNTNYKGQTVRILLLDTLTKLIRTTPAKKVTEQQLIDIFENNQNLFSSITSGKRLSDKCEATAKTQVYALFKQIAALSGTQPANRYLFNADGLDLGEAVEKTIMGAVFYYQATYTYLGNIELDDNKTVVPGEGTAKEHHWDEAFGYLGAPIDFKSYTDAEITARAKDTNGNGKIDATEKPFYHANYALSRDNGSKGFAATSDRTQFRNLLMDAFLKGRAAISNKDEKGVAAAKTEVLNQWERLVAVGALHYLNDTRKNATALEARNHTWTEAKYFVNMLRYSPVRKITNAQIDQLSGYLKDKPGVSTDADYESARALFKSIYGFSDFQAANL